MSDGERLASLSKEDREAILTSMSDEELEALQWDASFWLRPKQVTPEGDWYITALVCGRGFGKGIHLSTPILTGNGWKTMGEVEDGDEVFDETGKLCKVEAAHEPYMPDRMYKITFTDGTEIRCDGDHLWSTWTIEDQLRYVNELRYRDGVPGARPLPKSWTTWTSRKIKNRATQISDEQWWEIVEKNRAGVGTRVLAKEYGIARNFIRKYVDTPELVAETFGVETRNTDELCKTQGDRHLIHVTEPLQYPEADLPIDPWVLGIMLADGNTATGAWIATHVDDREWLVGKLAEHGHPAATETYQLPEKVGIPSLPPVWKSLGLHEGKYVPKEYFTASVAQRLALLQGLIDGDGHVNKNGSYSFTNTNKNLVDAVVRLARSLGAKTTLDFIEGSNSPRYRKKCKDQWQVRFRSSNDLVFTTLPRKVAKHGGPTKVYHLSHEIKSIEEIAPESVRCLTVGSASKLYLVTDRYISTHNTLAMSQWIRKKAMEKPGLRIAIAARTAADVRNTVVNGESGILAVHPPSERPEYKPSTTSLHWPNGSMAQLLSSESPDSARGPQYEICAADEFAAWKTTPDSSGATLYDNLIAATRLGDNPQLLLATTPKRTHVMRDLLEKAKDPAQRIRIVRGSTFDNKANLSRFYLENLIRRYGNSDLAKQELMGQMLEDAEGIVFTSEMLSRAKELTPPRHYPIRIIAVDPTVSAGGDETKSDECGIIAIGATGERDMSHRKAWVIGDYSLRAAPDVWAKQVVDAAQLHRTKFVVVEKNQGGQLLQMAINAVDPTLKVFNVVATQGKRTRSEPVVIAMQQGRIGLTDDFPELEDQLLFYDPDDKSSSPDRMDAMVWGIISTIITPAAGMRESQARLVTAGSRRLPQSGVGGLQRQHFRAPRQSQR